MLLAGNLDGEKHKDNTDGDGNLVFCCGFGQSGCKIKECQV